MPNDSFAAEALTQLSMQLTRLAEQAGQRAPDSGFAKLVNALNSASLTSELEKIKGEIGELQEIAKSLSTVSAELAKAHLNDSGRLSAPATAGHALPSAAAVPAPEEKPHVDRVGAYASTVRGRVATVEQPLVPAKAMISESASVEKELLRAQVKGLISEVAMASLHKAALDAQKETQLPPLAEAQILSMLAERFGKDPAVLAKLLPIFSNFADAQMLMKDTPYGQSAQSLLTLGTAAKLESPDDLGKIAEMLNRSSLAIPGTTESLAQMVTADIANLNGTLGMSLQDVFLANAAAGQAGFLGDSNGLNDILTRAVSGIGAGGPNDKTGEALAEMGLIAKDKDGKEVSTALVNGHLDFQTFLERLAEFETKTRDANKDAPDLAEQKIASAMRRAFGPNDRLAASLAAPGAIGETQELAQHFNDLPIKNVQKSFDEGSLDRQLDKAKAALQTMLVQLGRDILPPLNAQLRRFNDLITGTNDWLEDHKEVAKDIGYGVVAGGVGLSGLLGYGLFKGLSTALFGAAKAAPEAAADASALAGAATDSELINGMDPFIEELSYAGRLGSLASGVDAAALGAATEGGAAVGLLGLLSNPVGLGALFSAGLLGGGYEMNKWTYDRLNRTTEGRPGESEEERQEEILDSMMGGVSVPRWEDKPKLEDRPKQIDTYGGWGTIGKWLGLHHIVDNPDAVSAKNQAPAATPSPAFVPTDIMIPTQSGQLGPTVERAAAAAGNAGSAPKPQNINVQVQPGQVIIQLDGHTIGTAVMSFFATQSGGPNTGPVGHDPQASYTPIGALPPVLAY